MCGNHRWDIGRVCGIVVCALFATRGVADGEPDHPPPGKGPPAPKADDRTFVADQGPGLDVLWYGAYGPLFIELPTTRYLGPTKSDGTLENAAQLIQAGLLSPYADLRLMAWDVDDEEGLQPQWPCCARDRVYFNGAAVSTLHPGNGEFLTGPHNEWHENSFLIPLGKVKFPSQPGSGGNAPTPATNVIRIDVDVLGCNIWSLQIEWVSLAIKCMSPIVLIHGNGSTGEFFSRQLFTLGLLDEHLGVYDHSINLARGDPSNPSPGCAPRAANARELNGLLPPTVSSFGADSVHLVAHSKGGLDTREYLALFQPQHDADFKVLSLTTLSTPHNGSVGADVLEKRSIVAKIAADVHFSGFPGMTNALAALMGTNPGNRDLQTAVCANFNASNVPALARVAAATAYGTVAADADRDGSFTINQDAEYWEMTWESDELAFIYNYQSWLAESILNTMYRTLRNTTAVRVSFEPYEPDPRLIITTLTAVTGGPFPNDCMVTAHSGLGLGGFASLVPLERKLVFSGSQPPATRGRNHASVADSFSAKQVAPWLVSVEQQTGDLK
jgi:pimeloyl-ACP methyl ester carboxylesterase